MPASNVRFQSIAPICKQTQEKFQVKVRPGNPASRPHTPPDPPKQAKFSKTVPRPSAPVPLSWNHVPPI